VSFFPSRLAWLPLVGTLVVVAGCGSNSSSPKTNATATAQSAAAVPTGQAVPTQGVPPTAVITGGDTAAIVNGKKVPMSSYRLLFNFTQREYAGSAGVTPAAIASRTMEQVVAQEIARQYADSHGIKVSSSDLNKVVQAQEQRSGGAQAFQTTLARFGLTTDTFKQLVEPSLIEQKVAQKIAPIQPSLQPVAQVRHILIGTMLQPGKRLRSDAAALYSDTEWGITQMRRVGLFAAAGLLATALGQIHPVAIERDQASLQTKFFDQELSGRTPRVAIGQFDPGGEFGLMPIGRKRGGAAINRVVVAEPGIDDDLSYHELVTGFLEQLCSRTQAAVYCGTAQHFETYMKTPPTLRLLTTQALAKHRFSLRFWLSKYSHVGIVLTRGAQTLLSTSADFPYRGNSFTVPALKSGSYQVVLTATDPPHG